jgi:hypothetical protein
MATWEDVSRLALALPETEERSSRSGLEWTLGNRGSFAWERPLRKGDLEALGDAAPAGEILGVRVADEGVKFALVADDPAVYFTTPHFNGYPAVLVQLDVIDVDELSELLTEAWLVKAPKKVAKAFLDRT